MSKKNATQVVLERWEMLPEVDKRLIRFYLQFPSEDLAKKVEQFGEMAMRTKNNSHKKDYLKQVELYGIAYFLKYHNIPVKGGKRKTRRGKMKKGKKRFTRKA